MRIWLFVAGLTGAAAVALGAAGAHLFAVSDERFETALAFHIWHGLALIGIALLSERVTGVAAWLVHGAGGLFVLGTLLFSGVLYSRALDGPLFVGAAPVGGSALILGWLVLAGAALALRKR